MLHKHEDVEVPAVLALWSTGYSAGWIADVLNLSGTKPIERILASARAIGDRRAVLHRGAGGNARKAAALLLKYPWMRTIDVIQRVEPLQIPLCRRGHRLTKLNTIINKSGPQCRRCKHETRLKLHARIKAQQEAKASL